MAIGSWLDNDVVGNECVTCDRFYFLGESFAVCRHYGHYIRPVQRQVEGRPARDESLSRVVRERELRRHLARLEQDMAAWKQGRLSTWELAERVHKLEDGPVRKLFTNAEAGPYAVAA